MVSASLRCNRISYAIGNQVRILNSPAAVMTEFFQVLGATTGATPGRFGKAAMSESEDLPAKGAKCPLPCKASQDMGPLYTGMPSHCAVAAFMAVSVSVSKAPSQCGWGFLICIAIGYAGVI